MMTSPNRRRTRAPLWTALTALLLTAFGAAGFGGVAAANPGSSSGPIVKTENGAVRGVSNSGVYSFLGLPYAAPPIGRLRWQPPQEAPHGTVSVTRPTSRRAARSRKACSPRLLS